MKIFILYFFIICILNFSCKNNQKEESDNLVESLDLPEKDQKRRTEEKKKAHIDFDKTLKVNTQDSLPYILGETLFQYCCVGDFEKQNFIKSVYKFDDIKIKEFYQCEANISYPDSIFFKINNRFKYILKTKGEKSFVLNSCRVLKYFKRTNEISFHIAISTINEIEFLFAFTYSNGEIIDHYPLSVLEKNDEYNETAIYISNKFRIEILNTASYEDLPGVFIKKYLLIMKDISNYYMKTF